MSKMNPVVEVGLPVLDEEIIDTLAEECEQEVTRFILDEIPAKSIETLLITCTLEFDKELHLTIEIDVDQKYETGQDLDVITTRASEHVSEWLEKRLREMQ